MFIINGSIKCSDIDYGTNSFYIHHNFGFAKSSAKSFSFELDGKIEQFRPSYVSFRNNEIKVSLGTYRFNENGVIRYSFTAFNAETPKEIGYAQNLYFNLTVIHSSILFAKMNIRGITPGNVVIQSDIEFSKIQNNRNPLFFWDTPSKNVDASNSNSLDVIYKDIVGYYYAFNRDRTYFITKADSYIRQSDGPYTGLNILFPTSGVYYFHVRAVNSAGNMSRNTSHAEVIYNDPPTSPGSLMINGYTYYDGSSNRNIFSWVESSNSDNDDIKYEMLIYRNGEVFYNNFINGLRCHESDFYSKMYIYRSSYSLLYINIYVAYYNCISYLFSKMNITYGKYRSDLYSKVNIIAERLYAKLNITDAILHAKLNILEYCRLYARVNIFNWIKRLGYGEFVDKFSKKRDTNRLYYIYNTDISKNIEGNYYYKLRAYDWAEQSEWSDLCYYDIIKENFNFYSKVWIGYPDSDKTLTGKVFLKGYGDIFGSIYVYPYFFGRLNLCNSSSRDLYGSVLFKEYSSLYGSLYVDTNFSDLYGKLKISWVPKYTTMEGRLSIITDDFSELYGSLGIRDVDTDSFYGSLFVIGVKIAKLYGFVEIIAERMYSKMNIIRNFSRDSNYDRGILYCKMNVNNNPPEPIVSSNVGNEWQNQHIINITWTVPETRVRVVAFEYLLSRNRITDFSSAQFLRTDRYNVLFDLKEYYDDGEYYFYILSVSDINSRSGITEYIIRYNNIPSTPSFPMYVNDMDSINSVPVVSRSENNEFKWKKSTHLDSDTVNYRIQISNMSNFSKIIVEKDGIFDVSHSDFISTNIKYDYSDLDTIYYWRVMAYDIHQNTNYGYIGRFKCNTKPGVPTNLRVENEV